MAERTPNADLAFERVVFFSDAVFAIAITLLVLEIKVPHLGAEDSTVEFVQAAWALLPKMSGFIFSFLVVGSMWIEHHRVFRYIGDYDTGLLWRNLVLLLTVAFMPFPTALYTENHWHRMTLVVYAVSLGMVGLAKVWVWRYAAKNRRLLNVSGTATVVRRVSRRSWAVPLTCLGTAILAGLGMPAAYIGFAFIPLVAWLLDRPGSKKGEGRGAAKQGDEADQA